MRLCWRSSGETIPADGHLLDAHAQINEAAVSGEYLPVSKRRGDLLLAGTINGASSLTLEVSGVGTQLRIAAIANLTRQAQHWKPRVAQIVDRIASVFTVSVIALAVHSPMACGIGLIRSARCGSRYRYWL